MYVYPVVLTNKSQKLNFKTNKVWAYDSSGKRLYKKTTNYFRDDLDWSMFADYICSKYRNVEKVNVIIHACSNGMEAFSFAMKMISSHLYEAHKFFPIVAKDIDEENIAIASEGLCNPTKGDLERIKNNTFYNYSHFLIPKKSPYDDSVILTPKDFVKNKVIFEQGDIFDDIEKMPKNNTILFCRNFWPYLIPEKQQLLAQKLSQHFSGDSSLIVIGDYDASGCCEDLLYKYDFIEIPFIKNVYKKNNPSRPLYLY